MAGETVLKCDYDTCTWKSVSAVVDLSLRHLEIHILANHTPINSVSENSGKSLSCQDQIDVVNFPPDPPRVDNDFFDVTLACDDERIQAHKVIHSVCFPFFRNTHYYLSFGVIWGNAVTGRFLG